VIPMAVNRFHYPHPEMTLAEVTGVRDGDGQAGARLAA